MSWALGALLLLSSCGDGTSNNKESEEDSTVTESQDFAKGADISWVTEMESQGHVLRIRLEKHVNVRL